MVGPGAHHHAFWVPFAAAAGIVGAARIPRGLGSLPMVILCAFSFPWVGPRHGPDSLRALISAVPPNAPVAADYDTIHLFAGRDVLWNIEQLNQPDSERPYGWHREWPIQITEVDFVILPAEHALAVQLQNENWQIEGAADGHLVLTR